MYPCNDVNISGIAFVEEELHLFFLSHSFEMAEMLALNIFFSFFNP